MALIVSAVTGVVWAWCLQSLAAPGRMWIALALGAAIGVLQGVCIRPFKDSDLGEKAIIVTAGLFGTAFLYLSGMIVLRGLSSGHFRPGPGQLPSMVVGLAVTALWLTSMAVPFLWPFAAVNHALIWWLQTDRATRPPTS